MLGPQAEPGDCVAVLYGSSVPWVLREQAGGCCAVDRQCFIDGMVYGEAVTWAEDEADTFVLI